MKTLVVATGNLHKVQEIKEILEPYGYQVLGANECGGMPEVVEDGKTFQENAVTKAVAAAKSLNRMVLADDSGLEVFALGGEPGVYSARYAGEGGNDGRNLAKLLLKLEGETERAARFVCAIAVANPDGAVLGTCEGEVRGRIAAEARGNGGFGYDPAFIPDGYTQTFGELPAAVKNSLSHRANALRIALREIFHVE